MALIYQIVLLSSLCLTLCSEIGAVYRNVKIQSVNSGAFLAVYDSGSAGFSSYDAFIWQIDWDAAISGGSTSVRTNTVGGRKVLNDLTLLDVENSVNSKWNIDSRYSSATGRYHHRFLLAPGKTICLKGPTSLANPIDIIPPTERPATCSSPGTAREEFLIWHVD